MRIAIVHPSLAVKGGAESVVIWFVEELARRGHEVTVFTSDYDDVFFGAPATKPFSIVIQDLGGYEINPLKFIRAGWRLRHQLAGFDWVNPHNFPAYHWVCIASVFNLRVRPVVWFCEEPMRRFYPEVCNAHLLALQRRRSQVEESGRPRWRRWASRLQARFGGWKWKTARLLDRWIVPRLDLILANSQFIANQVTTLFRVEAYPCLLGIPIERFVRRATADTPPPPGRYLLTVSRLFPEKNLETVLEAIAILKVRRVVGFDRYVITGDGPLRSALHRRAKELDIDDIVEFKGFVTEDELAALYRYALLVIYLPLDETFGLVFPEAALYKKAVIGPNHGGPSEIIQDGVTGFLVDPTDSGAIAARIEFCLRDPDLLSRLGEEGFRYVTTDLTIARFVDRFEALLSTHRPGTIRRRVLAGIPEEGTAARSRVLLRCSVRTGEDRH